MPILHRYLSLLVFSVVALALVSCEESDDAKQARYAKAMENAKVMLKVVSASGADDPSKQQRELTPEEKAALAGSNYGSTQPPGPPTGAVAYPYYTTRGPRDFLAKCPPSIGPQ